MKGEGGRSSWIGWVHVGGDDVGDGPFGYELLGLDATAGFYNIYIYIPFYLESMCADLNP